MACNVTRLDNDLVVVSEDMAHLQSVALGLWVKAGSRFEDIDEHGIAHFLEHMAFKGTKTRSARDIAETIEAVGGEINAHTSMEHTSYFVRLMSEHIPLALDVVSDIILNSTYNSQDISREKEIILQEIKASHDSPEDYAMDMCYQCAFPDQPIGRPILGTKESIAGFDRENLTNFLNRHYQPPSMIVAASGRVDHDLLVELVGQKFGAIASGEKFQMSKAQYQGGQVSITRELEQVHITLGFEGVARSHPDFYAMQIFAAVLGGGFSSRLFQELREQRGLCYDIYSCHSAFSDCGLFLISSATSTSAANDLLLIINHELAKTTLDISQEEVARAAAQLSAGIVMGLESPAARASRLAKGMLSMNNIEPIEATIQRLERVTAEDVRKIAANIIASNQTLVTVGPASVLQQNLNQLDPPPPLVNFVGGNVSAL